MNDAVDLFLEYSPAVEKHNEHEQEVREDKTETEVFSFTFPSVNQSADKGKEIALTGRI